MKNQYTQSKSVLSKTQVKQMITSKMEMHRYVATSTGTAGTAGAFIYKSAISQTDDLDGRTGDIIRPVKLSARIALADTVDGYGRIIFFQDSMNTGGAPATTDVLASAAWNAEYNPIYQANGRFKILIDDTFALSSSGNRSGFKSHEIKLKGTIGFLGTGGTSAAAGKGSLWTLIISNGSTQGYDIKTTICYYDA